MKKYLIGFISDNSTLTTKGGKVALSSGKKGASISPFMPALERVGQLVLVQGELDKRTLYETTLIETTPLLISTMIKVAIDNKSITWAQFEKTIATARNIVIGEVKDEPEPIINTKKPRLVIDIGHRASAPGACSKKFKICEFPLNTEIANLIKPLIKSAEVIITSRDPNSDGQSALAAKINALKPDFVLSLHANAASPAAEGTEMLYFHTSEKSKQMAGIYQKHVLAAFGFKDRKILPRKGSDRGGALLQYTHAPTVLTEPFFLSNDKETEQVLNNKSLLAKAYADAVEEIVKVIF